MKDGQRKFVIYPDIYNLQGLDELINSIPKKSCANCDNYGTWKHGLDKTMSGCGLKCDGKEFNIKDKQYSNWKPKKNI